MNSMKFEIRVFTFLTILLISMGLILIPPQNLQKEVIKNKEQPLNLSDTSPLYIYSVSINYGSDGPGVLENTHLDDISYKQYNAEYYEYPFFQYGIELNLNFNPPLTGDDYKLSVHIESSSNGPPVTLYINNQIFDESTNLDFNLLTINNVNSIKISANSLDTDFYLKIFYFELEIIESSTETWYESFEDHELGYFTDPNWYHLYGSNYLNIVEASTYSVDMEGKVFMMDIPGWSSYGEIERSYGDNLEMNTGDSLYLKFSVQVNKNGYGSYALITLLGDGYYTTFFQLKIGTTDDFSHFAISYRNKHDIIIGNTIPNHVYDFDILFHKDPIDNEMRYYVYINQDLAFMNKVDIGDLFPNKANIRYEMYDDGPGKFFLDNFYLGYVGNSVSSEVRINPVTPIYYLYVPEPLVGIDHVDDLYTKFRYFEIHDKTLTISFSVGASIPKVIGVFVTLFSDMTNLMPDGPETYKYEVQTDDEDVIIYYKYTMDISNITFFLPGTDPQTGFSEIKGLYNSNIVDTKLTSASITAFQQLGYDVPIDYYGCSRSGNSQIYDHRTTKAECTGSQTKYYEIETRTVDLTKSFSGGLSFPIFEYFSIGVSFKITSEEVYKSEVKLGVNWDSSTTFSTKIQYDLYAPPAGTYSTKTDMPPFSIRQVQYHKPSQTTGLTAIGGAKRVDLSWNANSEADIAYYNIYRDGVKIASTTSTNFADTGLEESKTYKYKVAAVNIYKEEGITSIEVQATTDQGEITPGFTEWILLSTLGLGVAVVLYRFHLKVKKQKER